MSPDDVIVSCDPWVSGPRAEGYRPEPLHLSVDAPDGTGLDELLDRARRAAAEGGFNALVGMEITADPFRDPDRVHIELQATVALLKPLFGGDHVL